MSRVIATMTKHPFWGGIAATVLATGLLAGIGFGLGLGMNMLRDSEDPPGGGWWPIREVDYRCDGADCPGANHVVFNSILNSPSYGDERAFVDARKIWETRESQDPLEVQVGDEVIVRAYADNNANPARIRSGNGAALDTSLRFSLPPEAAEEQLVEGVISATNASPTVVGDTVTLVAEEPIELSYVDGSARVFNSAFPSGFELDGGIVEDGVLIGFAEAISRYCCQLDGVYPACDPKSEGGCDTPGSVIQITVKVKSPA